MNQLQSHLVQCLTPSPVLIFLSRTPLQLGQHQSFGLGLVFNGQKRLKVSIGSIMVRVCRDENASPNPTKTQTSKHPTHYEQKECCLRGSRTIATEASLDWNTLHTAKDSKQPISLRSNR